MAPSVTTTILGISLANGNRSISDIGAIRTSGTIGGGGAKASISMQGPLPIFNPVVEFFHELQQNYQGVRIQKL
jgi:hypothetical protein